MRTVEVSRFIRAPPSRIERALDPAAIVEYVGSFSVFDVREREADTVVVAGGSGLELTLRFEEREDGYYYEQMEGEDQPLETMETVLTYAAKDEGSTVMGTSTVGMGVTPAFLTDRIAAWKRRGELRRCLDALADDVE